MDPTPLQNAESWATIVGVVILFVGAIVAFWKLVLQQPFGNKFEIRFTPCYARSVQDESGHIANVYTVIISVENQSAAVHNIRGWWRRLRFADEVEPEYNPDGTFEISEDIAADERYGTDSLVEKYALASGETYADQLFRKREGARQEICYIEYTLKYDKWFWRGVEYLSQIAIVPIQREDLTPTRDQSPV